MPETLETLARRSASVLVPLVALVGLTVGAGCRMDPTDNPPGSNPDMAAPADMALPPVSAVIECPGQPLPEPPAGSRCVFTASPTASKRLLLRGTVLMPDRVLHGGSVVVDEMGKIACADCDCASAAMDAAQIVCRDGVISPGLINTHDHITYTKAAPGTHPTNRYDHRHEWRLGVNGDPTRPKIPVPGGNNAQAVQWGELRQLMAGTTSLVGSGQAPGVLRNIDTSSQEGLGQTAVDFDTFPLGDSGGERLTAGCGYPNIHKSDSIAKDDSYEPHISEGVNLEARNEFLCIGQTANGGQNLLVDKTAIIHGIALTAGDACLLAQRGSALIWSPRSNVSLYGHTAQVPMVDRAGGLIALGTDWTASGSMNLLRELKCADQLNQHQYGGYFSAEMLWRMVTLSAAKVTATDDVIGLIQNGYVGDLTIFLGSETRRDHAAVVQASVEDVLLVLRGGLPMYGDAALMEGLGAGIAAKCESLDVCSVEKRLCVERETGKTKDALETGAGKPIYQMFTCGAPADEPSCVPLRAGQFDGQSTADDPDGDGLRGVADNCPSVFNPIRPMDSGVQADTDGDGVGDACDVCPLDKNTTLCPMTRGADCDADGIPDTMDNCLGVSNADQKDLDMDGQGDACDVCPLYANPMAGPCQFSVKELRDPGRGLRPPVGTKVKVDKLLIVGLRSKTSFGFHARDLDAPQDYAGIQVFMGGMAPPKASDGTVLQVGQVVSVVGTFAVYQNQDEIDRPTSIVITGTAPVDPLDLQTRDLVGGMAGQAERLENLLVRVQGVNMRRLVAMTGDDDFFVTDDAAETCQAAAPTCTRIGDFLFDGGKTDGLPAFTAGGTLSSVVGIVNGFANQYSIEPRQASDLTP